MNLNLTRQSQKQTTEQESSGKYNVRFLRPGSREWQERIVFADDVAHAKRLTASREGFPELKMKFDKIKEVK